MAKGVVIGVAEYILRLRDEFTAGVERSSQMVEKRLTAAMAAAGASAMSLGNKMQAAFLASTKEAIGFESAFAGVRKTIDGTEAEFAQINDEIRKLSLEIPVSAEELARLAEAGGQLGISKENIIGFTRTMADLGVATNLAGEEGATMLAQFANITQMDQSKFSNLASAIVDLGNNGASTEADIASMALRIAGAGETAGMAEADILGISAALANVGIEAEAGGSAISKIIIDIASSVAQGGEQLNLYAQVAGQTAEQFAAHWSTAPAEALGTFIAGLQRIQQEGGNVFLTLENLGITEVRMRDALLRSANAGDNFAGSLRLANQAWAENAALATEAAERYQTAESQLQLFNNNLDELKRVIGESVLPVLRDMIQSVIPLIQKVAEFAKEHENLAIAIAVVLGPGGYLLDWAGQLAIALAGLKFLFGGAGGAAAAGAAGAAGGGLIGAFGSAAAAVVVLGAQIVAVAGTITIATTAIVAMVNEWWGLIDATVALKQSQDGVNQKMREWGQQLEEQGNKINWVAMEAMDYAQAYRYLSDIQKGYAEEVALANAMAADATVSTWQRVWNFFYDMWTQVSSWIGSMLGFGGGAPAATQALASGGVVGLPGFANGGVIGRDMRAVMVGERGPEVAALPVGTRVLSHDDTMRALGGGVTVNVNNPVVRQDADIDRLARAVGRAVASVGKQRMMARGLTPDLAASF